MILAAGDNIYEPSCVEPKKVCDFNQVPNENHSHENIVHDLSGQNVLVFDDSYYLGRNGVPMPDKIDKYISRPNGPTYYGYKTLNDNKAIDKLLEWVKRQCKDEIKGMKGVYGMPCMWDEKTKEDCGGCR